MKKKHDKHKHSQSIHYKTKCIPDYLILSHLFLITVAVCLTLFLSGCVGGGDNREVIDIEIFKGSEGLVLSLADDSPPEMVLENQDFPLGFLLENRGAHDIETGYLSLISENDYIVIDQWEGVSTTTTKFASFQIDGKSDYNPEGDKEFVVIKMTSGELEEMSETHSVLFGISACYEYKTYFSESVCIDPDIFGLREQEKTCTVEDVSSSGQGAPVAVTFVEPNILDSDGENAKPQFKVVIKNVGEGEVIKKDAVKAFCSSGETDRKDLNEVEIVSATLSGEDLDCTPNPVVLRDGEGFAMCDLSSGISAMGSTYSTLLTIELSYGYTSSVSGVTEIRKFTE